MTCLPGWKRWFCYVENRHILYLYIELKHYILILTKCMESAFLRKDALFVHFCKTRSLLGYANGGQGGYFGYKEKFNAEKSD